MERLIFHVDVNSAYLSWEAAKLGTEDGVLIKNIILFSVLVYELVGPMLTKWALTKSGDIQPSAIDVRSRRMTRSSSLVQKAFRRVFLL